MTTWRTTPFTVPGGVTGTWNGSVLAEVHAPYVPILLHRLEVFKEAFVYESEAEEAEGLDLVNRQQEALLMSAVDRIVSEIRALREGPLTPELARDPNLDPYGLNLTSLLDIAQDTTSIVQSVRDGSGTVLDELRLIRQALAEGGGEDIISRLDTLIFLLGAL